VTKRYFHFIVQRKTTQPKTKKYIISNNDIY